ncbi:unnamed protein product [Arabis nemorensis]|uniref:Uncharacterized protein n=1 Tax=Arabis nemorensis TaxID=586526 RepID=A0A565BBI5_9BRAS|nr:unnamed protein product [Arabis nemorensis]
MDIWAWRRDGENFSWVHEHQDTIPFDDDEDDDLVLAMTSSKNLILCMTLTHWFSYDVGTRIWRKKREKFAKFAYISVLPFTESVLPCNGGVML